MRRLISIACIAVLLFALTACKQNKTTQPAEPITLFPAHSEAQSVSEVVSEPLTSVNKTYGKTQKDADFGTVRDVVPNYRTADSYAFEQEALSAAEKQVAATISLPETMTVTNAQIVDSADDGDNVYYRVYLRIAYRVETGEEIERSAFCNIGVHKAEGTAFDATQSMRSVTRAYSIFTETVLHTRVPGNDFSAAAKEIALAQLKAPKSGRFVQAEYREDASEDGVYVVYDVVCVGQNDFDMEIPCTYTVYMAAENGYIQQLDITQL